MGAREHSHFDGRLLASDARVALLLADDVRGRCLNRVLGVPKESSLLVTVIALGVLADAIHHTATHVRPTHPSVSDALLGGSLLDESLHRIAGDWSRVSPRFGTLVALAVVGASLRPALRAAVHGAENSGHRARTAWGHRYGYLVGARRGGPA